MFQCSCGLMGILWIPKDKKQKAKKKKVRVRFKKMRMFHLECGFHFPSMVRFALKSVENGLERWLSI